MKMKKNFRSIWSGKESRDFIYIDDQVEGIFLIGLQRRDINIGTGKLTTIKNYTNFKNNEI